MQQKDLRFNKELMKFKGMRMTFMNLIDEYNNNDSWIVIFVVRYKRNLNIEINNRRKRSR